MRYLRPNPNPNPERNPNPNTATQARLEASRELAARQKAEHEAAEMALELARLKAGIPVTSVVPVVVEAGDVAKGTGLQLIPAGPESSGTLSISEVGSPVVACGS